MISVTCPNCALRFDVEEELRGRKDRCPCCAVVVDVPIGIDQPTSPCIVWTNTTTSPPLAELDAHFRTIFQQYLEALATTISRLNVFTTQDLNLTFQIMLTARNGNVGFTITTEPGTAVMDTARTAILLATLFAVRAPRMPEAVVEATLSFAIRDCAGHRVE